jgi:hypothetical protein
MNNIEKKVVWTTTYEEENYKSIGYLCLTTAMLLTTIYGTYYYSIKKDAGTLISVVLLPASGIIYSAYRAWHAEKMMKEIQLAINNLNLENEK